MSNSLTNIVHEILRGALFAEAEADDILDAVADLFVEIGVLDLFGDDVLDEQVRILFAEVDFVGGWGSDFCAEARVCGVELGKGDV